MRLCSGQKVCMAEPVGSAVLAEVDVWVVYSPLPRVVYTLHICLPFGSTVGDALKLAYADERFALAQHQLGLGLWNRKVHPTQTLLSGDRIEIYRPLRVDPKVARRERFQKQGARSAGLFAKRKPVAKPGD